MEKHGIDFRKATELWHDEKRVEIHAPHPVENRYILIGKFNKVLWTAVYTIRENKIRIISVRHSSKKEASLYEEEADG